MTGFGSPQEALSHKKDSLPTETKVGKHYLGTSTGPAWCPAPEVLLHSILSTHLEVLGSAAHRVVNSLSLIVCKQSLDGHMTVLWMEPLHGR